MIEQQIKDHYQEKQHEIKKTDIVVLMLPSGQMAYSYTISVDFVVDEFVLDGETVYGWTGETLNFIIPAE